MQFEVQQTIIPPPVVPPTSFWEDVQAVPLVVGVAAAIVVMAILVVPILLVVVAWENRLRLVGPVRRRLGYPPLPEPPPVAAEQTVLLRRGPLELLGIEQLEPDREKLGPEFRAWLDQWEELASQEQHYPGLHRLQTQPEIAGLHGQLVSDLAREWPGGMFLQFVEPRPGQTPASTTWLAYLEFATLRWERVAETHGYYLLPQHLESGLAFNPELFRGVDSLGAELVLRVQAGPGEY
ncbi:hypothetical protein [Hymenobacter actinosclerus]|uniref:Uncharacterized protein n=1 Tax=Hymenobacter actinosclerus TaxID=82805 RepID=A0A1I0DG33_9BACT|nr:hypothetical protein [Hymenobacter actinosclerus]SET31317.1 hypothetical protein SAMN04487998_1386 [Hymenobacter actinosclerus]